jgi:hypothetical protein
MHQSRLEVLLLAALVAGVLKGLWKAWARDE